MRLWVILVSKLAKLLSAYAKNCLFQKLDAAVHILKKRQTHCRPQQECPEQQDSRRHFFLDMLKIVCVNVHGVNCNCM